jgi:hypothetical protein
MTRTDVMASSRPGTDSAAKNDALAMRAARRLTLLTVLAIVALGLLAPTGALAAGTSTEATSGYNQEPSKPSTGTSPSKETTTPSTPTTTTTTPATTTTAPTTETAKTLPFTGFDLRWSLAIGVLLMAAGGSIIVVQRRRGSGRG